MKSKSFSSVIGFAGVCIFAQAAQAALPVTGNYRITPRNKTASSLNVWGAANVNGTSVVQWGYTSGANAQFYVEKQTDGSYKIYAYCAKNSLQMLDYGGTITNGTLVHTWEDLAVDGASDVNQRYWLKDLGNGYCRIIPYNAGTAGTATLEIKGGAGAADGSALDISAYTGTTNQQFQFAAVSTPSILVNPKKGLPASGVAGDANMISAAAKMNCTWIYNWGLTRPAGIPAGIAYVPMVWGWYGDTNVANEVIAGAPGSNIVLSYNEPDGTFDSGGAQMDVNTQGLPGYAYVSSLKSHGWTIGGPACAVDSDAWMQTFMSGAASKGYAVDFIGFHNYDYSTNGAQAAYSILGFADYVYSLYGKPMWATEFAPANLPNTAEAATFVRIVCQGFQSRSFIQRYSMFTSEAPSASGLGASALVNTDGSLTAAGKLYGRM